MIDGEIRFLMAVFFNGAIMCGIYDIIRIKRRVHKTSIVVLVIEDIIYNIVLALTLFRLIYIYNDGYIRIFAIIVTYIGMYVFEVLAGKFIVECGSKIINLIRSKSIGIIKKSKKSLNCTNLLLKKVIQIRKWIKTILVEERAARGKTIWQERKKRPIS